MTAGGARTPIRGVRVFDGERLHQAGSVLLAGGTIAGIGAGLGVPAGAEVIDGRGRTLLPGLIDCHVHAGDVRALGQRWPSGSLPSWTCSAARTWPPNGGSRPPAATTSPTSAPPCGEPPHPAASLAG